MDQNVKCEDRNGNIRDKDTALVRGDRGYRMRDNDVALHLPDSPADGITLAHSNRSIRLLPQGGSGSARLADNSITYPGYFGPETALRYTPLLSGVKEDIILSSYTGQNSFCFILETGGLYLYETDGQYYLAENESAEAAFYLGQIVVYDAIGRPDKGSMAVEVLIPGQQYRLTLSADVAFLTDPETVYPVTIDPSLTVSYSVQGANAIEDAPIFEGYPNKNFCNYYYNRVGYLDDTYQIARTVMRPAALLSSEEWQSIEALDITSLKLYIKASSGNGKKQVNVHPLTENSTWTESSITWSNVGSHSSVVYASATLGLNAWSEFDLTTLARSWKTGAQNAQCSFLLKIADETLCRAFFSCEYSTVDYRPYMVLEYEEDLTLNYSTVSINEGSSFTLTATTQFGTPDDLTWKSDNIGVATVSENGVVTGVNAGKVTITASCTDADGETISEDCTIYVKIMDGIYYILNASSGLCLQENAGSVNINAKITAGTSRVGQLWKITYIAAGTYVVRPLLDLSTILRFDSSKISVADASASDTAVPYTFRVKIIRNSFGCAFQPVNNATQTLIPVSASTPSSQVYCGDWNSDLACHWVLEKTVGVFLRDTTTFQVINTSAERYIVPDKAYTLASLGLSLEYYGNLIGGQSWSCNNYSVVQIDNFTGTVTGIQLGEVVVTVRLTLNGTEYGQSFSLVVANPPEADPFYHTNIQYLRYTRIKATSTSPFGSDTDHTVSIVKSSLLSYDYCIVLDNINVGDYRCILVNDDLKNTLNSLEESYQEHYTSIFASVTTQEESAHAAKLETDQLVAAGYFTSNSSEYYGTWAFNYTTILNYINYWQGVIDTATKAYSVYLAASSFYYSYLATTNTIQANISSANYSTTASYLDDIDDAIGTTAYTNKTVISAEARNYDLSTSDYTSAPYKPGTPVVSYETTQSTQFVRVYTEGTTTPTGKWVMKYSDIEGLTAAQIKDKFALPNTPTHYCFVDVPSGIQMYAGFANEVAGWGAGGAIQFELAQFIAQSCFGVGIPLP